MRITLAQMNVGRELGQNESTILSMLSGAQPEDLVVFPEGALTGYFPDEEWFPRAIDPGAVNRALEEIHGEVKRLRCHCVVGTATFADGVFRNSAVLQSHSGTVAVYHKMRLGGPERRCFEPGPDLPVFDVGGVSIGIQICREVIFPEPWFTLKKRGAKVVLHVNNAIKPHDAIWDHLLIARALENSIFVCSVNNAAISQELASYLVDPHGRVLLQTDRRKQHVLTHDIDPGEVTADLDNRRDF